MEKSFCLDTKKSQFCQFLLQRKGPWNYQRKGCILCCSDCRGNDVPPQSSKFQTSWWESDVHISDVFHQTTAKVLPLLMASASA